jgi:hypothetical protein
MSREYDPGLWDLDHFLDSTRYDGMVRCVKFVERQLDEYDDRQRTEVLSEFEPLIRVAFLMALVAQMEHHLKKICEVVAEKRNLAVHPSHLKGADGFEKCVLYLDKVLLARLPEADLRAIRSVVRLRNVWVHEGGYIEELPGNLGPAADHVGKTTEGQICLGDQFFEIAAELCKSFVEAVVGAVTEKNAVRPVETGGQPST